MDNSASKKGRKQITNYRKKRRLLSLQHSNIANNVQKKECNEVKDRGKIGLKVSSGGRLIKEERNRDGLRGRSQRLCDRAQFLLVACR